MKQATSVLNEVQAFNGQSAASSNMNRSLPKKNYHHPIGVIEQRNELFRKFSREGSRGAER